jgi:hypothetical protein
MDAVTSGVTLTVFAERPSYGNAVAQPVRAWRLRPERLSYWNQQVDRMA